MKQRTLTIFFLISCVALVSAPKSKKPPSLKSKMLSQSKVDAVANSLTDSAIKLVFEYLKNSSLIPIKLEDIGHGISLGKYVHAGVNLTDGRLLHMASLRRISDIKLHSGGNIGAAMDMGLAELGFDYSYHVEFIKRVLSGGVHGKIRDIKVHVNGSVDIVHYKFRLENFKILHVGEMNVQFTGYPVMDWAVNLATHVITSVLHDNILEVAQSIIKDQIEYIMATTITKKLIEDVFLHMHF